MLKAFKFFNIFHEIFRINVELNFALNLLLGFFKWSKKIGGQILKFPRGISEFGRQFFFKDPKLSAS